MANSFEPTKQKESIQEVQLRLKLDSIKRLIDSEAVRVGSMNGYDAYREGAYMILEKLTPYMEECLNKSQSKT